jgi:hypothetical protein
MVKALGADIAIDYTKMDFTKSGTTYDVIFDAVGKRSFSQCKRALTQRGLYLTTAPTLPIIFAMLMNSLRGGKKARFVPAGLMQKKENLVFLSELFEAGKIKAVAPTTKTTRSGPTDVVAQVAAALVGLGWSEKVATEAATQTTSEATDAERGSVAAELALALPAVVLVMVLGVGALGAAARQVALQDAAADAARLLGRGESAGTAGGMVSRAVPGAALSSSTQGELVCVETRSEVGVGSVIRIPLRATSCALGGGR